VARTRYRASHCSSTPISSAPGPQNQLIIRWYRYAARLADQHDIRHLGITLRLHPDLN
jgi:hypothetical protein